MPYAWEQEIVNMVSTQAMSDLFAESIKTGYEIFAASKENEDAIDAFFQSNYGERKLTAALFTALMRSADSFLENDFTFSTEVQKSSHRCYVRNERIHLDFFSSWSNRPKFALERCKMNGVDDGRHYGIIEIKQHDEAFSVSLAIPRPNGDLCSRYVITTVDT